MAHPAWAAEKVNLQTAKQPPDIARVRWKKLMGRVVGCDLGKRSIKLEDKNGNISQIIVDQYVQIFRDWRLISLNDVNLKDHLIIKRSSDVH